MIAQMFFKRPKIECSSMRICIVDFDSRKYQRLIKSAIYQQRRTSLGSIRNHSKRKRECSTLRISMRSTRGSRSVPRDVSLSPSIFVSFAVSTISFRQIPWSRAKYTSEWPLFSNFAICRNFYKWYSICQISLHAKCGKNKIFATAFINYIYCCI